jgi:Peptidase family M23
MSSVLKVPATSLPMCRLEIQRPPEPTRTSTGKRTVGHGNNYTSHLHQLMSHLGRSGLVRIHARYTASIVGGVGATILIVACGRAPTVSQVSSGRASVIARTAPEHPYVETTQSGKSLNFQLRVHNAQDRAIRIARYMVSVYDSGHRLVLRKAVDGNAFAPSITVLGSDLVAAGATIDLFNPLSTFDADVPLDALTVSLCVQREESAAASERNRHRLVGDCDEIVEVHVTPAVERRETELELPLHGRISVWDAHDSLSHHMRVPLDDPRVVREGLVANSNQFAEDFIYTDDSGAQYTGDPRQLSNWFSYGKPVFAPADGIVAGAANNIPESRYADARATRIVSPLAADTIDPKGMGNYVVIDHGTGDFSVLLHMQPGSVTVAKGAHVTKGEKLGLIGFSGDSLFPHLHFTVMDGPEPGVAWGVPSYFSNFTLVRGTTRTLVTKGSLGTGDIVETNVAAAE